MLSTLHVHSNNGRPISSLPIITYTFCSQSYPARGLPVNPSVWSFRENGNMSDQIRRQRPDLVPSRILNEHFCTSRPLFYLRNVAIGVSGRNGHSRQCVYVYTKLSSTNRRFLFGRLRAIGQQARQNHHDFSKSAEMNAIHNCYLCKHRARY